MAVFSEYSDNRFSLNLTKIVIGVLTLLGIFLIITFNIDAPVLIAYLAISAIAVFLAAQTEKEVPNELLQANFFGDKQKTYVFVFLGFVIGTVLGLATTGGSLSLVLPTQALYLGNLQFFMVNIVAPLIEPLFWRALLFPTSLAISIAIFGKNRSYIALPVALLFCGLTFGIFHVNTFYVQTGGSFVDTYTSIGIAAVFAIIFIISNQLAGTVALEIGWHFANNLFSQGYKFGEILPTMIIWFIGFALVIEFADRISRNGKR